MIQILLLISISSLTVAAGILSSNSKVYFNSSYKKKPWKGLTKKFWTVVPMYAMILILTIAQYFVNQSELNQEKLKAENKAIIRDSILKAQYDSSLLQMKYKSDSSHNVTAGLIADNLGKYGFKLDSTGKELQRVIRDSAKTRVILPNDPVLVIDKIENILSKNGTNHFAVVFKSKSAGSTAFNFMAHYFLMDSSFNSIKYVYSEKQLSPEIKIASETRMQKSIQMPNVAGYDRIGIFIIGTYSNLDGSKTYPLNDLYYHNSKGNITGALQGLSKEIAFSLIPNK